MTSRWMVLSLLVACSGESMAQEREGPAPALPAASGGEAQPERADANGQPRSESRTGATADPSAGQSAGPRLEPIAPDIIDRDITLALNGQLTAEHLDPDGLEAARARFARAPAAYLERFEARFLVRDGASMQPVPAEVAPEIFLGHLYPHAPEEVRRVAARLRRIDQAALRDGLQADPHGIIAARDAALGLLAAGIDLPFDDSWSALRPEGWCIDRLPVVGAVIRVERACNCGEPLACAAQRRGPSLEVSVRVDENGPVRCRDCHSTYAVCRLPSLPANADVPLVIEGEPRGALTASGAVITGPPC